jgi:hypothetical protein
VTIDLIAITNPAAGSRGSVKEENAHQLALAASKSHWTSIKEDPFQGIFKRGEAQYAPTSSLKVLILNGIVSNTGLQV